MAYQRTRKINGGTETITYQDNGWESHFVAYDDGTTEEWYEPPSK